MNVIIVGCGRVGRALAKKLNSDGNDVTVIDTQAEEVHTLTEQIIPYNERQGLIGRIYSLP